MSILASATSWNWPSVVVFVALLATFVAWEWINRRPRP